MKIAGFDSVLKGMEHHAGVLVYLLYADKEVDSFPQGVVIDVFMAARN